MSFERTRDGSIETKEDGSTSMITAHGAGAEHKALLASPTHSDSASSSVSGRTSFHSHGRTWSRVSNQSRHQPRASRFSLQFPIQPSGSNTPTRATSPVREPANCSPDVQAALSDGVVADSGSFLTLIASQERKVLELKEEVLRAEADLEKLKKQWGVHEARKKREDVKRLTKLQTLQTSLPAVDTEDDANGSNAWMRQEMARRKALLSRSNTTGGRTVMPGQRHTRALSLLSPARDNLREVATPTAQRPLPRQDSLRRPARQITETPVTNERPPLITRGSETGDLTHEVDRTADSNIDLTQRASIDQEALLRTSKKMASEFKDGLWTFWEDLKQATVGEEHHSVAPARRKSSTQTLSALRKQGSKSSLRPGSQGSSTVSKASVETTRQSPVRKQSTASAIPDLADPSFWTQHGVVPPTQGTQQPHVKKATTSKHARQPSVKRLSAVSNDAWDTWDDSPEPSRSSSSVASDTNTLPSTVSGSPRSSGMNVFEPLEPTKRDPIPWPALKKSAGTLRRTASHLMSEWEKSLTPSPGQEYTGQDDYIGAGTETAAFGPKKRVA